MSTAVTISLEAGFAWQSPFTRKELYRILEAMRQVCIPHTPVSLTLTNDAKIAVINDTLLHAQGPTNILSFPVAEGSGAEASLLLSLDTYEREYFLYGQERHEHMLRLLSHGMSHLAGLDHGLEMDTLQEAAFAAGVASLL